jgi:hypothetical protein
MARKKTPQEKKEADYEKQRRTRWDSDKAARKAIPAAKARRNRSLRRAADNLIKYEEPEEVGARAVEVLYTHNPLEKYGKPETLRKHIEHQEKRRQAPKPIGNAVASRNWYANNAFDKQYVRTADKRDFLNHLHALEFLAARYKPTVHSDKHAAILRASVDENRLFLAGFLADEPQWRERITRCADLIMKKYRREHSKKSSQDEQD